ncbi:hypothetical protein [Desulfogranum marinum]|uniref:hypothetical protein n=1 Tax=Desulfogranum marinum TaxID=453220 RepID=UPI0019624188|nr:hypothetical protein [Desulfogranum marinum]MBM9514732.1 hypothetical protein [Desulfogranum marinum]
MITEHKAYPVDQIKEELGIEDVTLASVICCHRQLFDDKWRGHLETLAPINQTETDGLLYLYNLRWLIIDPLHNNILKEHAGDYDGGWTELDALYEARITDDIL